MSSSVRECSSPVIRCVLPKDHESVPRKGQEAGGMARDRGGTRHWWGSTTLPDPGQERRPGPTGSKVGAGEED